MPWGRCGDHQKGRTWRAVVYRARLFRRSFVPPRRSSRPDRRRRYLRGGTLGYLAFTDNLSDANLRKAIVYGSVLASYTVEDFSLNRLAQLELGEVMLRYAEMRRMTEIGE